MPENDEGTATQTANETADEPKVKDPEAVLKKNEELLGKLKTAAETNKALSDRLRSFEDKEADRERKSAEKRGDFEKALKLVEDERDKGYADRDAKYANLFQSSASHRLGIIAANHDVLPQYLDDFAVIVQRHYARAFEAEDGTIVWKSPDGLRTIDLDELIPTLKAAHGVFFKNPLSPGTGGEQDKTTGGDAPGGKKWADMNTNERSAAIRDADGNVEAAKKKYS